ncbi:composite domain of metallo-dependent hydrolase [Dichomitus squalens LYAD-421 SS1]|uniref:Composite domain of metallo-dependent hydrolase n=1 Tax=Dichomitus squalens (strain LYAD-421) TaxID=732165 RepID=R7SZN7_DICSQ|nr:composite domain of metallo-dependent hydrolase [Dichomitus squalens LYAD-421 SS1]EJF61654.1 composite domain of metallo-dependent hydrolase [Dichomitus squalens LYAD-421 SS1]
MVGEHMKLPTYTHVPAQPKSRRLSRGLRVVLAITFSLVAFQYARLYSEVIRPSRESTQVPLRAAEWLEKCQLLDVEPGPPEDFNTRTQSDRFVPGTRPTLITNATIWTGRIDGLEVLRGDILLDGGLIKRVGVVDDDLLDQYAHLVRVDAQGQWVSPGIIDLHSHLGVDSVPELRGGDDTNSFKGPVLPWLRALDGLNTRDDAYKLSIAGGLTTALVLPGSANAIGGQAILIKLRSTADRAPTGKLLENPYERNGSVYDPHAYFRYRHMKYACGENPDRVYSNTRMDTAWAFRKAYEHARKIMEAQDNFCTKATRGDWAGLGDYPEDLQWEALVDVLRGRVKVHTHCYETVDLDDLVRISNEFKFPIAAFHHAHETYLVPDVLKSAYGHPPAVALFATQARYKREAYRGSEFAPRVLADHGLQVVMKSDHPVLNSRYLVYEAQQAHYYGLPHNLALAAVTTTPAKVLGQDHRIGYVQEGYDADLVLWDSHPLALGATPQQVWIDGIAQLAAPHLLSKPASFQKLPKTPNFDKEVNETLKHDGLPPLEPVRSKSNTVVFTNVSSVFLREEYTVREAFAADSSNALAAGVAVVRDGQLMCVDSGISACAQSINGDEDAEFVDLEGGSIAPGLVSAGAPLGLQEIDQEASTQDGYVFDALTEGVPEIVGGSGALIRAADGLQFATRDALLAYRAGVTSGIVAPQTRGFLAGLNTAFSTGARHKLEKGALVQESGGVHVAIHPVGSPSVSTQIAALRHLLLSETNGDIKQWFGKIKQGEVPLVVEANSADTIASVLTLKAEVESKLHTSLKLTIIGGSEAHLLAQELGAANVGVILNPARPFPNDWEERRIIAGPPLTEKNAVLTLAENGVTVGLGIKEVWDARNARFDLAWAALESNGALSKADALALASVNLEKLLGVKADSVRGDLVVTRGGDLLEFSKVVAIISPRRRVVDLL